MSGPKDQMTVGFDDIAETALDWHQAGKGAVLATVVSTWGSAPRPVGSQLAVSGQGDIAGSVSGGCVEGAVVIEAQSALADNTSRLLEYGVSDDDAFAVGLACGGTIRILVEPIGAALSPAMLIRIIAARAARQPAAYSVNVRTWDRTLDVGAAVSGELAPLMHADKSGFLGDVFVKIHNPPLRMAVVGAVHIAQPLLQMARLMGFDTVLIDPRQAFATPERFPDQPITHDWPDEALQTYGLDARTAVVTLSHDPKIDDPAILQTLRSEAFYLGCLGSTRTHAKRVSRLQAGGVALNEIARISGPVGLDIGAKSPAEIAISILAEITCRLRKN